MKGVSVCKTTLVYGRLNKLKLYGEMICCINYHEEFCCHLSRQGKFLRLSSGSV